MSGIARRKEVVYTFLSQRSQHLWPTGSMGIGRNSNRTLDGPTSKWVVNFNRPVLKNGTQYKYIVLGRLGFQLGKKKKKSNSHTRKGSGFFKKVVKQKLQMSPIRSAPLDRYFPLLKSYFPIRKLFECKVIFKNVFLTRQI